MGNICLPKSSRTVKNHPPDNLLKYLDQGISTRSRLHNLCAFCAFVAEFEPKNAQEAVADEHWLKKSVYGLRQSPHCWYERLSQFLVSNGFTRGLQINQSNTGIFIHQGKYIKDLLKRFALEHVIPKATPMSTSVKLTKDEKELKASEDIYQNLSAGRLQIRNAADLQEKIWTKTKEDMHEELED
ncbi:hypothetical protein AgCh_024628 [Apium graveolens]